jgi:hypothetical protein
MSLMTAPLQRNRDPGADLRITLCGFFNKFSDALGIEEKTEA